MGTAFLCFTPTISQTSAVKLMKTSIALEFLVPCVVATGCAYAAGHLLSVSLLMGVIFGTVCVIIFMCSFVRAPLPAKVRDPRYKADDFNQEQLLKELKYLNDQLGIQVSACGCADYQTLCEYLAVNEELQKLQHEGGVAMEEHYQKVSARTNSAAEYIRRRELSE